MRGVPATVLIFILMGCATRPPAEAFSTRMAESGNADFRLSGQVVDEEGEPVVPDKVLVTASGYKATRVPFGDTSKHGLDSFEPTTSEFSLNLEDWSGVELVFMKEGFYDAHHSFSARSLAGAAGTVLAGGTAEPPDVEHEGVTVVMERKPTDSPILSRYGVLEFRPLGTEELINFDHPPPEDVEQEEAQEVVVNVTDRSSWPANGIVLLAEVAENGREVAMVPELDEQGRPLRIYPNRIEYSHVRGLRLVMTGKGGGFRRWEPSGDWGSPQSWRLTYRMMDLAPADDYQPELRLTPTEQRAMWGMGGNPPVVYFWFKTADGRYGKGIIDEMSGGGEPSYFARKNGEVPRLSVYARFYLNPVPGDRRLEDGRKGWGEPDPERPQTRPVE